MKECGYSDYMYFSKLNQKVNDPKMTFDPTSIEITCDSTQGSFNPSPTKICQSMWIQWPFFFSKTWTKGHWPLDDLWPQVCWGHMCDSTQGSLCPSPMKIHQSMWIQWLFFFKNLNQRSVTPRWPLILHLSRSHVWLNPRIIVSKSHENTSKYVDTVTFFFKNLNQRSVTPRWPLILHLSRSHVWLYPKIIVSKSHGNTLIYVDTVNQFCKIPHTRYTLHSGETKMSFFFFFLNNGGWRWSCPIPI